MADMFPAKLWSGSLALGMLVSLAGCAGLGSPAPDRGAQSPSEALEAVPLVTHVDFGVFEMDVFVQKPLEPGKVFRPTPDEARSAVYLDAPLYATAQETPHDPTFTNAGPFDAGTPLGVTLADWLAARATVAYLCTGGETARVDAVFTGLVPSGVYTFWNARLDFAEGRIVGGADIPLGNPEGGQNSFFADASGQARYALTWQGCNEASTGGPGIGPDGSARVFAIAYHSDGKTYGAGPGPFGSRSHVQLFGIVKGVPA